MKWIIGAVVALVVAIPVGTFVYIHFVEGDPPAKLTLGTASDDTTTSTTAASSTTDPAAAATTGSTAATTPAAAPSSSSDISGTWKPTDASQVGYRVKETLFGQSATAVGRTNQVTGT